MRNEVALPEPLIYRGEMLTPAICKAARALLGWEQTDLAREAGVARTTINTFERGGSDPRASTLLALEEAFERAGLIILAAGDVQPGGAGVRFRQVPGQGTDPAG